METLFFLGQLLCLAGLAYGAWLCLVHAGKYDAESLRADERASRSARMRGHAEAGPDAAAPYEVTIGDAD